MRAGNKRRRRGLPKYLPSDMLRAVQAATKLTSKEVNSLYFRFRRLEPSGHMSLAVFRGTMGMLGMLDDSFLSHRMFSAFDEDKDGRLNFVEFAIALGTMIRGTDDEKLALAFKILCPPRRSSAPSPDSGYPFASPYADAMGSALPPKTSDGSIEAYPTALITKASPRGDSGTSEKQSDSRGLEQGISLFDFRNVVVSLESTRRQLIGGHTEYIDDRLIERVYRQVASRQPDGSLLLRLEDFKHAVRTNGMFLSLLGVTLGPQDRKGAPDVLEDTSSPDADKLLCGKQSAHINPMDNASSECAGASNIWMPSCTNLDQSSGYAPEGSAVSVSKIGDMLTSERVVQLSLTGQSSPRDKPDSNGDTHGGESKPMSSVSMNSPVASTTPPGRARIDPQALSPDTTNVEPGAPDKDTPSPVFFSVSGRPPGTLDVSTLLKLERMRAELLAALDSVCTTTAKSVSRDPSEVTPIEPEKQQTVQRRPLPSSSDPAKQNKQHTDFSVVGPSVNMFSNVRTVMGHLNNVFSSHGSRGGPLPGASASSSSVITSIAELGDIGFSRNIHAGRRVEKLATLDTEPAQTSAVLARPGVTRSYSESVLLCPAQTNNVKTGLSKSDSGDGAQVSVPCTVPRDDLATADRKATPVAEDRGSPEARFRAEVGPLSSADKFVLSYSASAFSDNASLSSPNMSRNNMSVVSRSRCPSSENVDKGSHSPTLRRNTIGSSSDIQLQNNHETTLNVKGLEIHGVNEQLVQVQDRLKLMLRLVDETIEQATACFESNQCVTMKSGRPGHSVGRTLIGAASDRGPKAEAGDVHSERPDIAPAAPRMYMNRPNFERARKRQGSIAQLQQRIQRRRPEYKLLGPSKGFAVHFGHPSWNMVLNMMVGIRLAGGRISNEPRRAVEAYDFIMKEKISILPRSEREANDGDNGRPARNFAVRFVDYAPMVFRKIRELFGINSEEYLQSIGPEQLVGNMVLGNLASLSELCSEGKSGAFFYYSADGKYLIKTITRSAAKFLRHILKDYYEHIVLNPDTLVTRFYGYHAIRLKKKSGNVGDKLYFVIMGNVFHTPVALHRRYDLKGSWVGRTSGEVARLDASIALKDNDMVKCDEKIRIGAERRNTLLKVIEQDAQFFCEHMILDYSLLVGIHEKRMKKETQDAESAEVFSPVYTLHPETSTGNSKRFHQADSGGMLSSDGSVLYYLGIIDILTRWTTVKKLERDVKMVQAGGRGVGVSCAHPVLYARRFVSFLKDRIE